MLKNIGALIWYDHIMGYIAAIQNSIAQRFRAKMNQFEMIPVIISMAKAKT